MFGKKTSSTNSENQRLTEFGYLSQKDIYLDSACQSLRPQTVIDAINSYYTNFNACGDRVKYRWGQQVDTKLEDTRQAILDFLGLPSKDFVCSFTLNTTAGINAVLSQLPVEIYKSVITSQIEHNSVFLPTIVLAKRLQVPRIVLSRTDSGALDYKPADLNKAVVVVNSASNIDGRQLVNINELIKDVHAGGGIVIIDAAQTMAHYHRSLKSCQADAICFSGHKMYGPSIGGVVIKKSLLESLQINLIGGGMVTSVAQQSYQLLPDELHSRLEPGLQAYGEIIGLGAAIDWLKSVKPFGQTPSEYLSFLSKQLFEGLKAIDGIEIFNQHASNAISIYPKKGDAHRLAIFLSTAGIMARSGAFCCHYYLDEVLKLPPLLRLSVGLHNTTGDIEQVIQTLTKITRS